MFIKIDDDVDYQCYYSDTGIIHDPVLSFPIPALLLFIIDLIRDYNHLRSII